MLRKAVSVYGGLLVSYTLVLFCRIPIWDVEGVRGDSNILSRATSKMSHHPSEVLDLVLCPVCLVFGFMFTVLFLSFALSVLIGLFWTWGN